MLYESGQNFAIGKSGGNAGRIGQVTSSVVAYVDNQSVASCQIDKDFIQIAIADPGTETFVADISDIIIEYTSSPPMYSSPCWHCPGNTGKEYLPDNSTDTPDTMRRNKRHAWQMKD